jgi:putative ABC transport system permease protein
MHPLLRIALLCCPRSFRREYEAQIRIDAADPRWSAPAKLLFLCGNVAWNGLLLYIEMAARNLALAARSLSHARTYSAVAIATAALAVGANLAVASVLEGVLFRALPYPHADRLYSVAQHGPYGGWSYVNAHELAARTRTIERIGTAADDVATLLGHGTPARLRGKQVGENYFPVLGLRPQLGRFINLADMAKNVAVISDGTWRTYFAADARIVGKRIDLSGTQYSIIGVAPPQFRDPGFGSIDRSAYWIPDDIPAQHVRFRGDSAGFARLRPGVSVAAASADLHRIIAQLDRRYPNPALLNPQPGTIAPLLSMIVGSIAPMLWLLYAAVDVLLIIACANLVNLALVRAAGRERELVVRSALGASYTSLAWQLCAESAVLCMAGGIGGALLACLCTALFASAGARLLPRWDAVQPDLALAGYAVLLLTLVTLATGLLPLLWIRRDISTALKAAGRGADRSRRKTLRGSLIVAEIALALALVLCAGLIVRSFITLSKAQLGFDSSGVVAVENPPLNMASANFDVRVRDIERLISEMSAIPGVTAVAASHWNPLGPTYLSIPANVPANASRQFEIGFNPVTPQYFRVFGIPLLGGRSFASVDTLHGRQVAIVSESFARRFFGSIAGAIGGTVRPQMDIGNNSVASRTIVGVVGDIRVSHGALPQPSVYVPVSQFPLAFGFVVRTNGQTSGLAHAINAIFARFNPAGVPPAVVPYSTVSAGDMQNASTAAVLFGAFALIALVLSLAGIYAVTAYSVEQRTQEFGIRRAIGATNAALVRDVLTGALLFGAIGAAIGLGLTAFSARWFSALLFSTSPFDPQTFALVVALMLACTALAALVPAIRAARMQPTAALRYE